MSRSLTPRQQEIMARRAKGMLTKEIAADLGLSHITVKNHITGAYTTLGVENMAEAFIALGWLKVPEEEVVAAWLTTSADDGWTRRSSRPSWTGYRRGTARFPTGSTRPTCR